MGESESDCAEFLAELSSAVLPSIHLADPSARLSNLNFELTYDPNGGYFPSNPGPCTPLKSIPIVFPIPLDRIPTVSNLTVTTCTLVRFTRESRVGANATNSSGRPCCIREIRFRECNDMEIADFQSAIQSLRDADAWTTMERVVRPWSWKIVVV